MIKRVWEFLKAHWIKAIVTGFALVTALVTLGDLVEWVRTTVPRGGVVDDESIYHLSDGWSWGIVGVLLGLVAIIWILIWAIQELSKDGDLKAKKRVAEKSLRGNMQAARRIVYQLFPPEEDNPPFLFEKVERTYLIMKGGDTTVRAFYRIKAHRTPLHFWKIWLGAEPVAPGVDYLDDLHFKIKDCVVRDRVAYLVHADNSHRKELSVFFLPRVAPDDKDFRDIEFTYVWPGMVRKLLEEGEEDFSLTLKAGQAVPQFSYTILFHPSLQRKYRFGCEGVSGSVLSSNLKEFESQENGWKGWRYETQSAPAEGAEYLFRLTCRQKAGWI